MFKHHIGLPLLAAFVVAGALPQTAHADRLLIHRVQQEQAMHLPARGLSMAQVEKAYGAPLRKLPPRGGDSRRHPVIHRWQYPRFIVYFERDKVIHSVLDTPAGRHLHPAGAPP